VSESTATTSDDAFMGGQVIIRQPKSGYRAGLDAVLLAATVAPNTTSSRCDVLDLGAGVGTVGLCIARRCPSTQLTLLEREADHVALAQHNIKTNGLSDRVRVIQADLASPQQAIGSHDLRADFYDAVLANPPYHIEGRGTPAPDALKAASHAMPEATLENWVRLMARCTKPGGTATLIHRVDALTEILSAFTNRFGAIQILPIQPRATEAANRVIVRGTKGSRAPLILCPPFILHERDGTPTHPAQAILREGAAMMLANSH
jgi:tRNA1(Val) A37 N6-methylase TrmN6